MHLRKDFGPLMARIRSWLIADMTTHVHRLVALATEYPVHNAMRLVASCQPTDVVSAPPSSFEVDADEDAILEAV